MSEFYEESLEDCGEIRQRLKTFRVGEKVNDESPRVSVIIPAYNIAPFIAETLDSALSQTFRDFEIIVVNDGSADSSELEAALKPFFDKIIYLEQDNLGASRARNSAICISRGEYLAFLDGDDIWQPRYLEKQIKFLAENDLEMVYCDAYMFGERLYEGRRFSENSPSRGAVTPESLISTDCNVITSGTIIKKSLLERSKLFDVSLKFMQDFDLWFRLAKNGAKIGYQREVLLKYRVRPNSLSGSNVQRAWRDIRAMDVIKSKYDLTVAERSALDAHRAACVAGYELEQGKSALVGGDFAQARLHFSEANKFYRKLKLIVLIRLLRFSPKLVFRLFRKLRPAEFSFIAPQK